ncbi:multicopper oxidase domain-containing protein [Nocardioides sp.]|uniref:multicopper oxidase domain-containing protein n=1 Tax=Nocardioides sp. TaxID=35761 RepID=UPI003D0E7D5E
MTHTTRTRRSAALVLGTAVLTVAGLLFGPASPAAAATVSLDLYAVTGSTTLPGGQVVPVWGYCTRPPADPAPNCNAAGTAVTAPGGPVIEASVGDTVEVTVHNELGVGSALHLQGQPVPPDLTLVANGAQRLYSFVASRPGTYLYEAGLSAGTQYQTALGLHGALVVRPAAAGQAYADASTAYDDEAVLVMSEIDPVLNTSADPAAFDLRKFAPRYTLLNGRAHPDTDPVATTGGSKVLLRYVNAGLQYHSMGVLGASQSFIALDGNALGDARRYAAETIGPGQTADAIVTAPGAAQAPQALSVYDASMLLHNSNVGGPGGMYTSIDVPSDGSTDDATGPVSRAVAFDGTTLSAIADDTDHGNGDVSAAEYSVDVVGAAGTGTPLPGVFGSPTADLSATGIAGVGTGQHVIYVRSQDAAGNWGPISSVLVTGADAGGPTTLSPLVTPRVSNGTAGVALSATGDDSASGNTNVQGGEYFIDAEPLITDQGTGIAMTVNQAAPVASLSATIPAATVNGLTEGVHIIWIEAQDAQGNWGTPISVELTVDKTGPATSGVSVAPNPNNGSLPLSASIPAVRVSVTTMVDAGSTIERAEAFIDTVGANGSGIPLIASDGLFNDLNEGGYADLPLATIKALSTGNHIIHVHAKDAAGNWGSTSSSVLLVDKTAPVASGFSLTPNPTQGATVLTLSASVSDAWTPPVAAEWFTGTDPGTGNASALTAVSVTGAGPYALTGSVNVSSLSEGTTTLRMRVRDQAGNWSALTNVPVTVTGPLFFSTAGNTNPPGVAGTADDADVYGWSGSAYSRDIDLSTHGVPAGANVDGYDRVDATHFYLSFAGNVTIAGFGTVQDEDIVYYDNGAWSTYFDGTARGLTANNQDLDAISIVGATIYFSTVGNTNPPGVTGAADDADIYSWNGTAFARVVDATAIGLPAATNVDGLVWQDSTHQYLSFAPDTTVVPGLGATQDEDVVHRGGTAWSTYFNGTAHGLGTSGNLDLDAFDLP